MTSFFNYHEYLNAEDKVQTDHPNIYVEHKNESMVPQRCVRIPRDYSVVGDEYPYFSMHFIGEEPGAYPNEEGAHLTSRSPLKDILTHQQYTDIVSTVNDHMRRAFSPFQKRQFVETVLSFLTLWLFERLIVTTNQRVIRELDAYIERLNADNFGRFVLVNPRKGGFLSLDFLVPL